MKRKTERPFGGQIRNRPKDPLFGDEPTTGSQSISLEQIQLPTLQPRRYFDEQALDELVTSIKQHGILQPLLVRPLKGGKYELVAGERRYRAAQTAGLTEVPVVVRNLNEDEAFQLALIENLQREDLNPVEETEGILQLLSWRLQLAVPEVISRLYRLNNELKGNVNPNVGVSSKNTQIEEVNPNVGVSSEISEIEAVFESLARMQWSSFVKHRLPLLKLPVEILEALRTGKIAYTKAQAISKIKDEAVRNQLLDEAIANNLSLSQIKEKIQALKPQPDSKPDLTEKLSQRLTKISRLVKKNQIGSNSKKRKQLETLLVKLENLLESE